MRRLPVSCNRFSPAYHLINAGVTKNIPPAASVPEGPVALTRTSSRARNVPPPFVVVLPNTLSVDSPFSRRSGSRVGLTPRTADAGPLNMWAVHPAPLQVRGKLTNNKPRTCIVRPPESSLIVERTSPMVEQHCTRCSYRSRALFAPPVSRRLDHSDGVFLSLNFYSEEFDRLIHSSINNRFFRNAEPLQHVVFSR